MTTAEAKFKRIDTNDFIPMSQWSKDHWSMLAYFETVQVDNSHFAVMFNPRMRQNRRHYRNMPRPQSVHLGIPMQGIHGSRLNDGTYIHNHDDWNCVQDFAHAGLLKESVDAVEPRRKLHLSKLGHSICNLIREHKAKGGTFSTFKVKT